MARGAVQSAGTTEVPSTEVPTTEVPTTEVVVVGAGFGGLAAARGLAGEPRAHVTILDRHNYNTFQPLLYQVASSGLDVGDVAHSVRAIFRDAPNVSVRTGELVDVDLPARRVHLADGATLRYDTLVLAAGATTNFFGIPGAADRSFPIYTLADAVRLRSAVLQRFEAAEVDPARIEHGELTFVIVGGGPTAVELAGSLAELFERVIRQDFRRIDPARARVVLVEMQDTVLPSFRARSRRHAADRLAARGVELRLGTTVDAIEPEGVRLTTGEGIPARTVVWSAGVRPSGIAERVGLPLDGTGRVAVASDLSVPGRPEVFVVGDLAASRARDGSLAPQLAPVAIQGGRHAAAQISRQLAGRPTRPFRYHDKGTMATIGRRAAVADLRFGVSLSGTLAWLAWLVLHLMYLVGFRRRVEVLFGWAWNYFTWNWGPRLILEPEADIPAAAPSDQPRSKEA